MIMSQEWRSYCRGSGARCAIFGSGGTWSINERAAFHRRAFREGDIWHFARQTFQRKFLSQRKERISVPHQNAAQIGMAVELDSHHVVNLALVPIRGRPNVRNRVNDSDIFRQSELQSQMDAEPHRIELVNDFETQFLAEIVDAGYVDQIVERKFVTAAFRDPTQISGRDFRGEFTTKLCFVLEFFSK